MIVRLDLYEYLECHNTQSAVSPSSEPTPACCATLTGVGETLVRVANIPLAPAPPGRRMMTTSGDLVVCRFYVSLVSVPAVIAIMGAIGISEI